ncbi:putative membrane protein [Synechococcus sp. SYN20]|uniref:hypothetical protein n=1 Tax=Synechococcus sp. SYN20 TaxID=1050714 RepID=UPI001647E1B8|nr:hypothetical protein [Synechococcus sp. SYN20]QNJ25944.1 putative membrane protein [Synechococcus sp. SYN20]
MSNRALSVMRCCASALALIAYGLLTHGMTTAGIFVALAGQCAFIPWSIRNKVWDMVALDAFYIAIGLTRLVTL